MAGRACELASSGVALRHIISKLGVLLVIWGSSQTPSHRDPFPASIVHDSCFSLIKSDGIFRLDSLNLVLRDLPYRGLAAAVKPTEAINSLQRQNRMKNDDISEGSRELVDLSAMAPFWEGNIFEASVFHMKDLLLLVKGISLL